MDPHADTDIGGAPTSALGLDLGAVTTWLKQELNFDGPLGLLRIGHGQSNLTYLVESAQGERCVLRRPPLTRPESGAHDVLREFRILSALTAGPAPTPRPLAFAEGPASLGTAAYLMEYVDGLVLHTSESAEQLTAPARRNVSEGAAAALAALHSVDVDAIGLGTLGSRDAYAERQLRRWRRQWVSTQTRELPVIEQIADSLAAQIPVQTETSLVHGDYNLANLIVGVDGEVRSILDWELSTLGDPVADLGTLLCYWPDRPQDAIPERDPITLLPGFANRSEVIAAYARAAPERDLSSLNFWHALATWKLAIIFEGITRRQLVNSSNSFTAAETLRATTEQLAEIAASLVDVINLSG